MYGEPFGCSLCHAWGAGPILLLGKYCAGVRETAVGSAAFEVAPNPGRYSHFEAVVPMRNGAVSVRFADGHVTVKSDVSGGVLRFAGEEKMIPVGVEVSI